MRINEETMLSFLFTRRHQLDVLTEATKRQLGRTSAVFLRSTSTNLPAWLRHEACTAKTDSSSPSTRRSTRARDPEVPQPLPTSSSPPPPPPPPPPSRIVSEHSANRRASWVRLAFDRACGSTISDHHYLRQGNGYAVVTTTIRFRFDSRSTANQKSLRSQ